jgi:hypothetical protein
VEPIGIHNSKGGISMKFIPADVTKLNLKGYAKTDNLALLEAFADSGHACVKIVNFHHSDAKSCAASLKNSINRFKFGSIKVIIRQNEVYLIDVTKTLDLTPKERGS